MIKVFAVNPGSGEAAWLTHHELRCGRAVRQERGDELLRGEAGREGALADVGVKQRGERAQLAAVAEAVK